MTVETWRADFFENWDDLAPSRSITIAAESEEEAVEMAAAQMGDAARIEFAPMVPRLN